MTGRDSTPPTVPNGIPDESERRLATVRNRLQDIFGEIYLVRDVITISIEAMYADVSDFHPEMGRVLFRCGAEKLYGQLQALSNVIEQLGGRTEFTDDRRQAQARGGTEHVGA